MRYSETPSFEKTQTVGVELRARRESDLDACELLAHAVHIFDGYPPRAVDDLRLFVSLPDALEVWVAESERGIVGHVALQPKSSPAVMALASDATGQSAGTTVRRGPALRLAH